MAAEKQGSPTTTKKRTTGPPILPPINDNVSPREMNPCLGHWDLDLLSIDRQLLAFGCMDHRHSACKLALDVGISPLPAKCCWT